MEIEIWSDIVCPWCYIGKRRFEKALAQFPHRDAVTVTWRSFQLDPHARQQATVSLNQSLAEKYGVSVAEAERMNARVTSLAAGEGLEYRLDLARPGNTFDAHRLLHLAASKGLQGALKERLMRAYFTEGEAISDHETLARLAAEAGLDVDEARATLASDAYDGEVRADEARAAALGISGVPFFVIDARYGVSGAQPDEVFRTALQTAWDASRPLTMVNANAESDAGDAGVCDDESCAI